MDGNSCSVSHVVGFVIGNAWVLDPGVKGQDTFQGGYRVWKRTSAEGIFGGGYWRRNRLSNSSRLPSVEN